MGQSLENVGVVVNISYHFRKQRTLATGMTLAGVGLGMVLFPPLTQLLVDTYMLNGTFMLLGAVTFQSAVFAMTLTPHTSETNSQLKDIEPLEKEKCSAYCISDALYGYTSLIYNASFCVLCLSILCWSSAVNTCTIFLPDYFITSGSSASEAALILSLFGLGNVISRLLTGLSSVEGGLDSKILYSGSYGVLGIITLCLPFYGTYFAGKITFSLLLGVYSGGTFVLLSQLAIDTTGIDRFVHAMGIQLFVAGIGFLVGPTLSGESKLYLFVILVSFLSFNIYHANWRDQSTFS